MNWRILGHICFNVRHKDYINKNYSIVSVWEKKVFFVQKNKVRIKHFFLNMGFIKIFKVLSYTIINISYIYKYLAVRRIVEFI